MLFQLSPKDNGSYMVGSCESVDPDSGVPTCGTCGYRTSLDFTSPAFQLRKKRFDISCCYDGAVIVSDRFRTLYESLGGSNMQFVSLAAAPSFYHLKCEQPIPLAYSAMGTRRMRPCADCGRYLDVVGYERVTLQAGAHLAANDMAFSDWYFGSNNEANPLVLCGAALAAALRSSGFSGIDSCDPIGA